MGPVRAVALAGALLTGTCALDHRLILRRYRVSTPKLTAPVRLALLTDLHGCGYGPGQARLLAAVRAAKPDLVLLGGDMFADRLPWRRTLELLRPLCRDYPCHYVSGNHELRGGLLGRAKTVLRGVGGTVLEGERVTVQVRDQSLCLCGVDDVRAGPGLTAQLEAAAPVGDVFSLLLTHRPDRIFTYLPYGHDLILSGHAHGGQWRLPGLVNGLWAPGQGFFPKYAGGLYRHGRAVHIVSRGLARESTPIPRIFNRPELVLVDLTPAQ